MLYCSIVRWSIFLSYFIGSLLAKVNFSSPTSSLNFTSVGSKLILNATLSSVDGVINLKDNVAATVSGTTTGDWILFSGGTLKTGDVSTFFKGTFNPTSTDSLTLGNGDLIDVQSGQVLQSISVSASSTATILGQPRFSSTIALLAASSTLNLGITTDLNQNITGSGTLSLLDDLTVGKDISLPSVIAQNAKNLKYSGGTISLASTNTGGGNIELLGNTTFSALQTIGTASDVYNLNGNGTILTFSGTGGITFNGSVLNISDVHIKGLQTANPLNGTGLIKLSNVTLELSGNFVRSDGSFYIWGDHCNVITNGSTFVISGSGNSITIDNVILGYTQLDGTGVNPIGTASSGSILTVNSGYMSAGGGGGGGGGGGAGNLNIPTSSYSFTNNFFLTGSASITVTNATPLVAKNVSIDGANHFIHFINSSSASFLILQQNCLVTWSNIVFKDFNPAAISLGTSAANTYSDGVRIELGSNKTILSSDPSWVFNGNAEIDGNGATLRLEKSQGITISGAGKSLTLRNMRLVMTVADAVRAFSDTAAIKFDNVEIVLQDAGFTVDQGDVYFSSFVKMTGGSLSSSSNVSYSLTTKGNMYIGENSELLIDHNIRFYYNVDTTSDLTNAAKKRHIVLSNPSSQLTLCGGVLETASMGIAFDTGTIVVRDYVSVIATTVANGEIEISSGFNVDLASGAVFDVNGPLKYLP